MVDMSEFRSQNDGPVLCTARIFLTLHPSTIFQCFPSRTFPLQQSNNCCINIFAKKKHNFTEREFKRVKRILLNLFKTYFIILLSKIKYIVNIYKGIFLPHFLYHGFNTSKTVYFKKDSSSAIRQKGEFQNGFYNIYEL